MTNVNELKRLHLGCGLNTPEGWINLDGSWNAWIAKYPRLRNLMKSLRILPQKLWQISWSQSIVVHDVRKPLPFKEDLITAIYASHFLEHLYLDEAKRLLLECYRILQPGGVLRVIVPNLESNILEYIENKNFVDIDAVSSNRADIFNQRLFLRNPSPPSGNILFKFYSIVKDYHSHKWLYDLESMIYYFKWAGFSEVAQMNLHQSRIEGIESIELPQRVIPKETICVEGVKLLIIKNQNKQA